MKVTSDQVHNLLHGNSEWESWVEPLQKMLPAYEIDTPERIAMFMAQCGHESNNFRVLNENLNYSAKALNAIFPKYFERAGRDAEEYHRQPEKIANVIYANRMGNGPIETGDGWTHKGIGIIQLTGKNNQTAFANSIDKTIERTLEYLGTKEGALESACWFWKENGLNRYADDILRATKKINGGTIGLEDRKHHYKNALDILGGQYNPSPAPIMLKVGSTGEAVKLAQAALGLEDDGVFGLMTEKAVKAWQEENGLTADGLVGPKTYKALVA